jgi:hypothetical protein
MMPLFLGASVSSPDGRRALTTADTQGHFEIPPEFGWPGADLSGPISFSLLPHFDIEHPVTSFRNTAGYHPKTFNAFAEIEAGERKGQPTIRLRPK